MRVASHALHMVAQILAGFLGRRAKGLRKGHVQRGVRDEGGVAALGPGSVDIWAGHDTAVLVCRVGERRPLQSEDCLSVSN